MINQGGIRPGHVLLLGALVALGPLSTNLYLPAFPAIAAELGATDAQVQLTMTTMLIGMAAGHLLLGSLSDAFGRRRPLLVAYGLYTVVSLAIAAAPTIEMLTALRVLQGVLGAAGMVIALAVVRDMADGFAIGRTISRLMLIVGVAPILAPTLGGQLLLLGSWRWMFVVLAVLAVVLVVLMARYLPESLPPANRRAGGTRSAMRTFGRLLRSGGLVGVIAVAGATMAGQFTYVTGSTFVFQGVYGLSAQQYALVFGAGALVVTAGTQVTGALIGRLPEPRIALIALGVALTGALGIVLVGVLVPPGPTGLALFLVALAPTIGAVGMIYPVIPSMALARHPEDAGSTAALIGACQFGMAGIGAPMSSWLGGSVPALGAAMAMFFGVALVTMAVVARSDGAQ